MNFSSKPTRSTEFEGKRSILVLVGIFLILAFLVRPAIDAYARINRPAESVTAESALIESQAELYTQAEGVLEQVQSIAATSGPFLLYAAAAILLSAIAVVVLAVGLVQAWAKVMYTGIGYERERRTGEKSSIRVGANETLSLSQQRSVLAASPFNVQRPQHPPAPPAKQLPIESRQPIPKAVFRGYPVVDEPTFSMPDDVDIVRKGNEHATVQ